MSRLVKMKIKFFETGNSYYLSPYQFLISPPYYSGLQFNQLTRTEIPAEYIENVQLYVEDKLVWEYNGTIGIAQDVFFMMPIHTEGKHVVVYARDNLENEFTYDNAN